MPTYGVVDMGSNTVRLVVYDVERAGAGERRVRFHSIINDKVMAGLASYVENGTFTQAGVERASKVLSDHLTHAAYFGCKRTDVFATAVLRNAENGEEAVRAIEQRCRCGITMLSGADEARLGFAGAACDYRIDEGLIVDIGGGSTEITRIEAGEIACTASIGQGSLSSYERFVAGVFPTPQEARAIACEFERNLAATPGIERFAHGVAYGVGGSVRATAKLISLGARPKAFGALDAASVVERCLADGNAFAHHAARAVPERMHTAVPGCIILTTLMRRLGVGRIFVCKHGLRDGYLLERMVPRAR